MEERLQKTKEIVAEDRLNARLVCNSGTDPQLLPFHLQPGFVLSCRAQHPHFLKKV